MKLIISGGSSLSVCYACSHFLMEIMMQRRWSQSAQAMKPKNESWLFSSEWGGKMSAIVWNKAPAFRFFWEGGVGMALHGLEMLSCVINLTVGAHRLFSGSQTWINLCFSLSLYPSHCVLMYSRGCTVAPGSTNQILNQDHIERPLHNYVSILVSVSRVWL